MRKLIAAAAVALVSAGAAQAATYRYDVTYERTSLSAQAITVTGDGSAPDNILPDLNCVNGTGGYECGGAVDFSENQYGIPFLAQFQPIISVRFDLKVDEDSYEVENRCTTLNFACRRLGGMISYAPTTTTFSLGDPSGSLELLIDEDGLSYADDRTVGFTIDGVYYQGASGQGLSAKYTASNINIAPVPLPASAPLLIAGLGGIWMVRRKRAA